MSARAATSHGVLTRKVLFVFGSVALPLVTALAFLVGHVAARTGTGYLDWELASIFGTALGTTLLAVATGALAYTTAGDVRATWELADLTRQDLELSRRAQQANIKPRLVDAPEASTFERTEGGGVFVVVYVRNVGAGVALIQDVTMRWDSPGEVVNPTAYIGTVTRSVVPPDELTRAEFVFGPEAKERVDWIASVGRFWVEFVYVDSAGEQGEVTRLDLNFRSNWGWVVSVVSFRRASEGEPYASTGVGVR
jgi:hypothetical protein